MKLHVINTGYFKLDGGAMFGVVPKSIWQKTNPPDENNLCNWSMRCLLIENNGKMILIDNGIGDKQDAKFFSHYQLSGETNVGKALNAKGISEKDITDMFLTHLHFDHCGGGVRLANGKPEVTFRNAKYWSNPNHWKWATQPNPREKASFLTDNILPMQESGQLNFIDVNADSPFAEFDILYVSGHTDKMMIPKIKYKNRIICYMADLLPCVGHIPLPYVMAYDTRPLMTMEEKEKFLNEAAENNYVLFFEHDAVNECCTVKKTEKGVRLDQTFLLSDL
jgi:glyoxylase-like metal-dependent hydrolase (beta-lactamase superfamily II)